MNMLKVSVLQKRITEKSKIKSVNLLSVQKMYKLLLFRRRQEEKEETHLITINGLKDGDAESFDERPAKEIYFQKQQLLLI